MSEKLDQIAEALRSGQPVVSVTVRNFLEWFGAKRRGIHVRRYINDELANRGIITVPDFDTQWLDNTIDFALREGRVFEERVDEHAQVTDDVSADQSHAQDAAGATSASSEWIGLDPTYRISRLEAANNGIEFVAPDTDIADAVTVMLSKEFSQLAVMTTSTSVKGVISWRSIGYRLALGKQPLKVKDCMEADHEVSSDTSIFEAIPLIVKNGYVLVRNERNAISGIVTASDLSTQFQVLTEPFLLLGEIENLLRNMIGEKFTSEQLRAVGDPKDTSREIGSVVDLAFGEYIRLLEEPSNWDRLQIKITRNIFCDGLKKIRDIRNDVMHFDPDGPSPDDLVTLRKFAQFLKTLAELDAK